MTIHSKRAPQTNESPRRRLPSSICRRMLLRRAAGMILAKSTVVMAQGETTMAGPTWPVDLRPFPGQMSNLDLSVKVVRSTRYALRGVGLTTGWVDDGTLVNTDEQMSFTLRQRIRADNTAEAGLPIEASLEVLNWKATENGQSASQDLTSLKNLRFEGRIAPPESRYDIQSGWAVRDAVEKPLSGSAAAKEFSRNFALQEAFVGKPRKIGEAVYLFFPVDQLPIFMRRSVCMLRWTLVSVQGGNAVFEGMLLDDQDVGRSMRGEPLAAAAPGVEFSSRGRLEIDMKQRRVVRLTFDAKWVAQSDSRPAATSTETHVIQWRAGK
ncbi:hypothetical protein SAMN05216359_102466 [Roseateles sp. YR242]|uniref:hypothetical protein n=1 Tax=Roseateles sp. YR242 TaxID=1855305 RepID=UPI0008C52419|nr:hypothetical protein [Roseateles sp. YR242]SEK63047.1 hypothetical protein SAMN05216359_102466 [Roseateles sp. YR242]